MATFNAGVTGAKRWRLPTINELESLVDCSASKPALPGGHPFASLKDVYWSFTTSCSSPTGRGRYLDNGGVGVGQKREARFFVWAVRDDVLPTVI